MRKLKSGEEMQLVCGHVAREWLDQLDSEFWVDAGTLLEFRPVLSPWKDSTHCL